MTGVRDLVPGERFPDLSLPDSDGNVRRLTELAGPDPLLVHTYRGWFCPKERAYLRRLVDLQGDAEVAYTRFVSPSVESPVVNGAFRAGLDARWTFLSDEDRTALNELGLREVTDTVHDPYLPTVWLLAPDLTVHRWWMGYWYWGRPTLDELRVELRALTRGLRKDWDPPRPDDKP
jgi:peroxiredoxin